MVSMLLLYLLFLAGVLLLFLRGGSTTTPSGGSAEDDALTPPEFQAPAPPARKTLIAVAGGMLPRMVCSWGFVRLLAPDIGHMHGWVPSDHEPYLYPLLMRSTAGLLALAAYLLISVRHHLTFGVLKGYATRSVGPLLVLFGCSGLIHLLAPGNGGGGPVDVYQAGLEVPLFFIPFFCLMGIMMLISFFGLNPANACRVYVPGQSSTDPAQTLVALSCAGLLHLLVRTPGGRGSGGLISGGLELPILMLFLAFMVNLVMVLSGISA